MLMDFSNFKISKFLTYIGVTLRGKTMLLLKLMDFSNF